MKEYEYEVIGYLLAKVDQETGEEVLNRHGDIKLFKHIDNNLYVENYPEESVEEIQQ
jgi:acyl-ACP thioesterase|tara:strand:- start:41 stop:211 length:171 start_codon:yes stop_codon:yes gene_type:complete